MMQQEKRKLKKTSHGGFGYGAARKGERPRTKDFLAGRKISKERKKQAEFFFFHLRPTTWILLASPLHKQRGTFSARVKLPPTAVEAATQKLRRHFRRACSRGFFPSVGRWHAVLTDDATLKQHQWRGARNCEETLSLVPLRIQVLAATRHLPAEQQTFWIRPKTPRLRCEPCCLHPPGRHCFFCFPLRSFLQSGEVVPAQSQVQATGSRQAIAPQACGWQMAEEQWSPQADR